MEGKVESVVKSSEPEPGINGHDKEESGPVGVTYLEKVNPCLLTDPSVVSGWVGKDLGAVESVKVTCNVSGLVICFCVSSDQREQALV